jgi:uncharacterized membrane protein YeaQ/YmgE (transglycosylase-associated protein family)
MVILAFFCWLVTGVIVGFIASKFVNLRGDDPRLGMAAAAVTAIITGWLYSLIRGLPLSEFNLRPIIVAAIAAAVAAIIWHLVRSRFISHDNYTTRQSY